MARDERDRTVHPRRFAIRRAVVVAAGVGGVLCLTLAVTTAASASNGHTRRADVIRLQSTLTSATTNSAGLGGPGDVVANLNAFTTSTGVAGHADITCQIFPNNERECTASFVFPTGQIDASAAITQGATTFTAPITGGSGAFEGVAGHIENVVAPPVTNRTFYLIYPAGD